VDLWDESVLQVVVQVCSVVVPVIGHRHAAAGNQLRWSSPSRYLETLPLNHSRVAGARTASISICCPQAYLAAHGRFETGGSRSIRRQHHLGWQR